MNDQHNGRLESIDALRGFDMLFLVGGAAFFTALAPLLPEPFGSGLAAHMTHAKWAASYIRSQILLCLAFLVGYWAILYFIPNPEVVVPPGGTAAPGRTGVCAAIVAMIAECARYEALKRM